MCRVYGARGAHGADTTGDAESTPSNPVCSDRGVSDVQTSQSHVSVASWSPSSNLGPGVAVGVYLGPKQLRSKRPSGGFVSRQSSVHVTGADRFLLRLERIEAIDS